VHAVTSSLLYVLPAAVTAAVAIAGFAHASSLSRRAQQAEEKRWKVDRKADAYERAVEYLLYRKQDRIAWLSKVQLGTASKKALRKAIAEFDQAGWIAMNARLMLYAADPVKDAVEAGNVAHNEVMRLGHEWNQWLDNIRKILEADGPQAIPTGLVDVEIETKERMMLALKAAFRAESALIEVLQSDMSGPRPAAAAWPGICGPADPLFLPGRRDGGAAEAGGHGQVLALDSAAASPAAVASSRARLARYRRWSAARRSSRPRSEAS
jgi:hypothetical protein